MTDYFTQFSTSLRVGPGNVEAALALYEQMQAELGDHDHIGFDAERDGSDDEAVWLWEGGDGAADIENVIAYAFRCAAAFDLTGSWGFHWSLTCSSPRQGAFGGGAQMLDLGRRESLGWMDCEHWVAARTDADGPCREPAERILTSIADTEGNVRRFLDVSSGHLSAETWIWLDAQTDADLVRASAHRHAEILGGRTRHGWFLYASEAPVAPIPADLAAIMRRARRHDCEYILFDVDARLSKDLPVLHPGFQGTPSPA